MFGKFICSLIVVLCTIPGVLCACNFTTSVQCRLKSDNSPCENLTVGANGTCGNTNVTYTYEYCNNDPTYNITFNTSKCSVKLDLQTLTSTMNFSRPLPAKTCRSRSIDYVADSCRGFYGSIFGNGFIGPKTSAGTGNYCSDGDFFRTVICTDTAAVDCITSDQQPCNKTRVTASNCTNVTATYYFTYCNLNSDPNTGQINLNNLTFGRINDKVINATDFSILPTQTCRSFQETATVNTCENFFSASMKTEGTIANVARYQYCYDYNFIKFQPLIGSDPTYNYTLQWCDLATSITCQDSKKQPCNNIIASTASCGVQTVTYNFTMCNKMPKYFNISLNARTFYAISGAFTPVTLPAFLNGTQCRSIVQTATVDTCKDVLPSQFKVEGTIINAPKYTYCYAFRFYKFAPLRPSTRPTKAPVQASTTKSPAVVPPAPTKKPLSPTNKPLAPTKKPLSPTSKPLSPTKKPLAPTNKPLSPTKKPLAPTNKPLAAPTNTPAAPTNKPAAPTKKPAAPTNKPAAPTKKPAVPTRRPTAKPAPVYIKSTYAPKATPVKATYAPKATPVKATYAPKATPV